MVGRFYLYEVYTDLDAFQDQLCTEHVRQFITTAASSSVSVGATFLCNSMTSPFTEGGYAGGDASLSFAKQGCVYDLTAANLAILTVLKGMRTLNDQGFPAAG